MGRVFGVNIVVGIPSFGMVSTYFLQSRQAQQMPLVSSAFDKIVLNKPIAEARNEIVEFALSQNANYIYWLDDDVIPAPDAFMKLYRHQKDIINGVYWSKSNPPMPLLFRNHLEGPYWNWRIGDLIEIDAAGNGLTLVKTDVYRTISEKLGGPWYSTEYSSFAGVKDTPYNNTEDLYFYWKARKAGFKIWADTSVQAMHFDKVSQVMYGMPNNLPQAHPSWEIKPPGKKLIADLGSGPVTPYMQDEGVVVSFDIREEVKPDVLCDIRYLPVPNETFDMVFSSHTLEHFGWVNVDKVLKEWTRILKVGGELRIVVPNLRAIAQRLLEDKVHPWDMWVIYGEQDYAKNWHGTGFTPNLLRALVESMDSYENIQVKEGDYMGPPGPNAWNLMLKATKSKHNEIDNITPEDILPGAKSEMVIPVRIYDDWVEREMTPEEYMKDIPWMNAATEVREVEKEKEKIVENAKKYPITTADKTFFTEEELLKEDK